MRQRYDDFADWYDAYATRGAGLPFARAADRLLARLLGPGHGRLWLDLGCGGGAHTPALTGLDWRLIGVDISAPQITHARRRGLTALVASTERLPLRDQSVDAAVTIMTTTDFDDLPPVFTEAHRVLRPGGRLVVVGAHPCFGGVYVERDGQGACIVHPGYRRHQRVERHPLLGDGIRARVGVVNAPPARPAERADRSGIRPAGDRGGRQRPAGPRTARTLGRPAGPLTNPRLVVVSWSWWWSRFIGCRC